MANGSSYGGDGSLSKSNGNATSTERSGVGMSWLQPGGIGAAIPRQW